MTLTDSFKPGDLVVFCGKNKTSRALWKHVSDDFDYKDSNACGEVMYDEICLVLAIKDEHLLVLTQNRAQVGWKLKTYFKSLHTGNTFTR